MAPDPRLDRAVVLDRLEPDLDERLSYVVIDASTRIATTIQAASIRDFRCVDAAFGTTVGEGLEFSNGTFENCDLATVDWQEASFDRVVFTGCRLSGADLSRSDFRDVLFVDCVMPYSYLRGSRHTRVDFRQCRMSEATFQGANIVGSRFQECDLEGVQFSQCHFATTEIISCRNAGTVGGIECLRGASVSGDVLLDLAPALAGLHGIGLL